MKTHVAGNDKKRFLKLLLAMALMFLSHHALAQKPTVWVVPAKYIDLKNPTKPDSTTLKNAKTNYIKYCAPCHGVSGKGDGPANASLNPNPANHTSILMLQETDGALWYKITTGRNPMPENKSILTENERWELVTYIRTLAKSPK
jgi:mono/diheme cytochrome c family protein